MKPKEQWEVGTAIIADCKHAGYLRTIAVAQGITCTINVSLSFSSIIY